MEFLTDIKQADVKKYCYTCIIVTNSNVARLYIPLHVVDKKMAKSYQIELSSLNYNNTTLSKTATPPNYLRRLAQFLPVIICKIIPEIHCFQTNAAIACKAQTLTADSENESGFVLAFSN